MSAVFFVVFILLFCFFFSTKKFRMYHQKAMMTMVSMGVLCESEYFQSREAKQKSSTKST